MSGKRRIIVWLVVFLVLAGLQVGLAYYLADHFLYAQQADEAAAARKALENLEVTGNAFKLVAKAMKPSVVSIMSVKTLKVSSAPSSPLGPNSPFEDFFGNDDPMRRFFEQQQPQQPREYRQEGLGSGVIVKVDDQVVILTNNHVVAGADEVTVQLSDKRQFAVKKKDILTDPKSDLAVIRTDEKGLMPAPLGDSDKMEVGDWVVAIGNPFGLNMTVTSGIVSAKGRALANVAEYEDFIQTDAAINPGNSGGPLVNLKGQVIGINTAIFSRSGGYMGIGFAIPSNMARIVANTLLREGKVTRGYLGVHIQDITPDLAENLGLEKAEGVLVPKVEPGSPAAEAGVKQGDIITEYNGKKINNGQQLKNLVGLTAIGTEVELKILRDGKPLTLKVKIAEQTGGQSTESALGSFGFEVQNLTDEMAQRLGYAKGAGVVISSVKQDSPASRAGLKPGMIIVTVQRQPVANVKQFDEIISKANLSRGMLLLVHTQKGTLYVLLKK